MKIRSLFKFLFCLFILALVVWAVWTGLRYFSERETLKKVVTRLEAETRVAEVIVTKTELDEASGKVLTTIKFMEYEGSGKPAAPKYFTFQGNVIQFQALVIRFEDKLVEAGDRLKGKSAFIFTKAFTLNTEPAQVFPITENYEIPSGYKIEGVNDAYEEKLWWEFWDYALKPGKKKEESIKNAQIEAPGSLFLPGTLYTIHIEHDGGLRIDTQPIPAILRGEKLE